MSCCGTQWSVEVLQVRLTEGVVEVSCVLTDPCWAGACPREGPEVPSHLHGFICFSLVLFAFASCACCPAVGPVSREYRCLAEWTPLSSELFSTADGRLAPSDVALSESSHSCSVSVLVSVARLSPSTASLYVSYSQSRFP